MDEYEVEVEDEAPVQVESVPTSLTAENRCDKCGAQAYVMTIHFLPKKECVEMFWCNHHFTEYSDSIGNLIAIDDRAALR